MQNSLKSTEVDRIVSRFSPCEHKVSFSFPYSESHVVNSAIKDHNLLNWVERLLPQFHRRLQYFTVFQLLLLINQPGNKRAMDLFGDSAALWIRMFWGQIIKYAKHPSKTEEINMVAVSPKRSIPIFQANGGSRNQEVEKKKTKHPWKSRC